MTTTTASAAAATSAVAFAAELDRNVNALYMETIDYPDFARRNRKTWDRIEAAGPLVTELVNDVLRAKYPMPARVA